MRIVLMCHCLAFQSAPYATPLANANFVQDVLKKRHWLVSWLCKPRNLSLELLFDEQNACTFWGPQQMVITLWSCNVKIQCLTMPKLNLPKTKLNLKGFDMTAHLLYQVIFSLQLEIQLTQVEWPIHKKCNILNPLIIDELWHYHDLNDQKCEDSSPRIIKLLFTCFLNHQTSHITYSYSKNIFKKFIKLPRTKYV